MRAGCLGQGGVRIGVDGIGAHVDHMLDRHEAQGGAHGGHHAQVVDEHGVVLDGRLRGDHDERVTRAERRSQLLGCLAGEQVDILARDADDLHPALKQPVCSGFADKSTCADDHDAAWVYG